MLKDVKNGTYRAKPVGGQWSDEGTKHVQIGFDFEANGVKESITAYLYLTEKASDRTFDTLINTLGYDEMKPLIKDGNKEWFDETYFRTTEVNIVLEHEEYQGKDKLKVKWINPIGGSRMAGVGVQAVLGNQSLKELAAAARARAGTKAPATVSLTEEIPF